MIHLVSLGARALAWSILAFALLLWLLVAIVLGIPFLAFVLLAQACKREQLRNRIKIALRRCAAPRA